MRVEHHYPIPVPAHNVLLYPQISLSLDHKNTFILRVVDLVLQNICISWIGATQGDICFLVFGNNVFLNISRGSIDQKNTLGIVFADLVFAYYCSWVFVNSDSTLSVTLDLIIHDGRLRSYSYNQYTILLASLDNILYNFRSASIISILIIILRYDFNSIMVWIINIIILHSCLVVLK